MLTALLKSLGEKNPCHTRSDIIKLSFEKFFVAANSVGTMNEGTYSRNLSRPWSVGGVMLVLTRIG